jgi:hypothetical protein
VLLGLLVTIRSAVAYCSAFTAGIREPPSAIAQISDSSAAEGEHQQLFKRIRVSEACWSSSVTMPKAHLPELVRRH